MSDINPFLVASVENIFPILLAVFLLMIPFTMQKIVRFIMFHLCISFALEE